MEKYFTSRTAALTYQTCPRKRFLAFHYAGPGLATESLDINMLTGSSIHRGLQHLLEHCRLEHPEGDFEEKCIDQAIEHAINLWRESISEHSLNLYSTEEGNRMNVIAEHECLIEGLIRVFAIHRLRNLLEEYEILEVEHEEVYEDFTEAVDGYCTKCKIYCILPEHCDNCGERLIKFHPMTFLGKADGLFRRKIDNKLVILSIKTTSEFAAVTMRNILHDMQGCSEWAAVQNRLDNLWNNRSIGSHLLKGTANEWILRYKEKPEIYAVQYEHLITGKRRQDPPKSGIYKRYNFLVHPMAFIPQTGFQLGSMQFVTKSTDYKWKWGAGKQPKGWEKIDIWTDIGIKNWIEMLAMGKIQPEEGNPFDVVIDQETGEIRSGCLHTSELIIRTPEEIEEWKVSTKYQEEKILENLNKLNEVAKLCTVSYLNDWKPFEIELQKLFPKTTQNCHDYYGKDCAFVPVCHFGLNLDDSSHLFSPRKSHHETERLYQIERGWIKDEK